MRANKKEAPILLAQNGPLRGMNWVVNRHLTIGRDDDCDIVIPDRQVSRFHAEVTLNENGDFLLSDLKSKNGTTLNGELLLEWRACSGDARGELERLIAIGRCWSCL